MSCVHLRQLVELCQTSEIRLSSSDLIHMVCHRCNKQEVCPSQLMNDKDADQAETRPDVTAGGPNHD